MAKSNTCSDADTEQKQVYGAHESPHTTNHKGKAPMGTKVLTVCLTEVLANHGSAAYGMRKLLHALLIVTLAYLTVVLKPASDFGKLLVAESSKDFTLDRLGYVLE